MRRVERRWREWEETEWKREVWWEKVIAGE